MQIDKSQIIELLKSRGDNDTAGRAENDLLETVNTQQHQGLLSDLGINLGDLTKKIPGVGGLGL